MKKKRTKKASAKAPSVRVQKRVRPGRVPKPKIPHNSTWLKAQLLIAGITQREIAAELGTTFPTVNHLISGNRTLRDSDAKVIARMLKMPLETFLAKLRSETSPAMPEGLARAVERGEIEITGWVDGDLTVHGMSGLKGPGSAPSLPEGSAVRVVRCQTQGSIFDGLDGALVYYTPTEGVAAEAVGHMCIVDLGDKSVLRVVKRGYSAGRFNLSLLNGITSEEDAHIVGASPVVWLKM